MLRSNYISAAAVQTKLQSNFAENAPGQLSKFIFYFKDGNKAI